MKTDHTELTREEALKAYTGIAMFLVVLILGALLGLYSNLF